MHNQKILASLFHLVVPVSFLILGVLLYSFPQKTYQTGEGLI